MSVLAGKKCVEMVADICEQLGYSVYVPQMETHEPWDIEVNGLRVQVKLRESLKEQQNRVRLKTYIGSGQIAYSDDKIDAFVIRWFIRWYIIPSHAMARHDGQIMNGLYMPSFGEWIDRWDVLDARRVIYAKQKVFDF